MPRYNPATIEPKWQAYWDEHKTFAAPSLPKDSGKKLYALDMFPYPSGDGLHVGHPEGYTATDIVCRARRMQGYSVVHPMGFDAFGLPAEEFAISKRGHPRKFTEKNIDTFRRQLKMLGFSYDWDREIATTDVDYFRWTQWIFLQLFDTWFDKEQQKGRPISELPIPEEIAIEGDRAIAEYQDQHRLAYQSEAPVNWCPALGTVLANEEIIDGKSERGGHPVERRPLRQWMLRITAYADRLSEGLEELDWPEGVKALQRNWIGRSTGAEVDFFIGRSADREGGQPSIGAWEDHFSAIWEPSGSANPEPPESLEAVEDAFITVYTHATRHAVRRHLHGDRPRAPLGGRSHDHRERGGCRQVHPASFAEERPRPNRTGEGENRRLHWLVRHQPGQPEGGPDLGRRLRANQLRHRGDHGGAGARRAGL